MLHRERDLALQRERSLEEKIRKLESREARPASMAAAASTKPKGLRIATVTYTSHPQTAANDAAARVLQAFDATVSDGSTTTTDDEGDHLTTKELAECATHVQQLLQRINGLQRALEAGQIVKHHHKRRMHKSYMRTHRRLIATFVGSANEASIASTSTSRARSGLRKVLESTGNDRWMSGRAQLADSCEILPAAAEDKHQESITPMKAGRERSACIVPVRLRSHRSEQDLAIPPNIGTSSALSRTRRLTRPVGVSNHSQKSPVRELGSPLPLPEHDNIHHGLTQQSPIYQPPSSELGSAPFPFYQPQQMQPMCDQQQPPLQAPDASPSSRSYTTCAPVVQVERSDGSIPSARHHANRRRPVPAQRQLQLSSEYRRPPVSNIDTEQKSSESESESESEEEQEYTPRMVQRSYPDQRHPSATPVPRAPGTRRPQTIVATNNRSMKLPPNRRESVSGPLLVSNVEPQPSSDTPTARVTAERPRSARRQSLLPYDKFTEGSERRANRIPFDQKGGVENSRRVRGDAAVRHDYERDHGNADEKSEPIARDQPHRYRSSEALTHRKHSQLVDIEESARAEGDLGLGRETEGRCTTRSYEVAKRRSSRKERACGGSESLQESDGVEKDSEIRLRIRDDTSLTPSLNGDMEGRILGLMAHGGDELISSGNVHSESACRNELRSGTGESSGITSASDTKRHPEDMTERRSHSILTQPDARSESDEPLPTFLIRKGTMAFEEPGYRGVTATKFSRRSADSDDSEGSKRCHKLVSGASNSLGTIDIKDLSASKKKTRACSTITQQDHSACGFQSEFSFVEDLLDKEWLAQAKNMTWDESEDRGKDIVDALLEQWTIPVAT